MSLKPTFELGEWHEANNAPWEVQPFCFVADIDLIKVCNNYINHHVNLYDSPLRLVDSYRSYLIQAMKDIDYYIGSLKAGNNILNKQMDYTLDASLAKAQPWRFTAYALKFISSQFEDVDLDALSSNDLWNYVQPAMDDMFEKGYLFRLEKYIKVGHVLMDISFDIGWDSIYGKASQLKVVEGLLGNPERAATLREISLYIARNFWLREYFEAARQTLFIGFPDIPDVITPLQDLELEELLINLNPNQALQSLFSDQMAQSTKHLSCNQIVEGALRIIGGGHAG